MTKPQDLRIGNWLIDGNGSYYQVEIPDLALLSQRPDTKECNPIELSAEILEKAGFDRLPGSTFVYRTFVKDFEISVSTELHYAYIDTQWGQASIKHPIVKYLHQLQNLFWCLCGEELPVEL